MITRYDAICCMRSRDLNHFPLTCNNNNEWGEEWFSSELGRNGQRSLLRRRAEKRQAQKLEEEEEKAEKKLRVREKRIANSHRLVRHIQTPIVLSSQETELYALYTKPASNVL